jgi:excisionase family DNA binding protein
MTLDEVASELGISRRSVERLIVAGRLRVIHPTPGSTRVEARELAAYIAWLRRAA